MPPQEIAHVDRVERRVERPLLEESREECLRKVWCLMYVAYTPTHVCIKRVPVRFAKLG
jgi:hypothetical protein